MTQVSTAEELLARVAQRDSGALSELYDAWAPSLLGVILRILEDRREAEKVLDEVFLRLWDEASAPGHERTSAAVRLVIMTRLAAVDRLRTRTAAFPSAQHHLEVHSAWLPTPEEIAALDSRRDLLRRIIKQLPERQRAVLDLAVFGGYTEAELAKKLGEPLGKVKSELRAALRFLRHRLRAVLGMWSISI